jgi:hypothetical protein
MLSVVVEAIVVRTVASRCYLVDYLVVNSLLHYLLSMIVEVLWTVDMKTTSSLTTVVKSEFLCNEKMSFVLIQEKCMMV